jgi:anti-sigma regulatory factor (Ser/Thr protein kinase)
MDQDMLGGTVSAPWRSSTRMPFRTGDLGAQRDRLVRDLTQHALPTEVAYDASLVLGELVANAVQHGEPLDDDSLDLCWGAWDGLIHVEVTDGGASTVPVLNPPSDAAVRGRGLAIVEALASSWGVRTEQAAVTVWATLPGEPSGDSTRRRRRRGHRAPARGDQDARESRS